MLPCEDNLLRNITCERPAHRVGKYDNLPCDVERSFRELLELEIDLFRRLEHLRKNLEARADYSSLSAYRAVDKFNDGQITIHNLASFLRSQGYYPQQKELV